MIIIIYKVIKYMQQILINKKVSSNRNIFLGYLRKDVVTFYITKTRLFKYIENFNPPKNWKFSDEKLSYYLYFCSKHRLWAPVNEYPQSMFLSRYKKNNVYPCKPQFYYIKVGFKGLKLCTSRHVFAMRNDICAWKNLFSLSICTDMPKKTVWIRRRCHWTLHLIRVYTVCHSSGRF